MADGSELLLSICPPGAALEVARSVAGRTRAYVDANAVAPDTARAVADVVGAGGADTVDGGIVGPPPRAGGSTRLYLSGPSAAGVAGVFTGTAVEARVVSERIGDASGLKLAYAAWSKGTAALVLAIRALARSSGLEDVLLGEWRDSLPGLEEQSLRAAGSAAAKGWRWVAEMDEIAATFAAAGLPDGFHRAAADVFGRLPRGAAQEDAGLVLDSGPARLSL